MNPERRRAIIEAAAEENEDANPVEWPKSRTRRELRGLDDETLESQYGYLVDDEIEGAE